MGNALWRPAAAPPAAGASSSRPQYYGELPAAAAAVSSPTPTSSLLLPQKQAPASRPQRRRHAPPPVPHGAGASSASTSRSSLFRPQPQPAPAAAPVSSRKQRRQRQHPPPTLPHGVAVTSSANTSSGMILRPKKQKPPPRPLLVPHGAGASSASTSRSSLLRPQSQPAPAAAPVFRRKQRRKRQHPPPPPAPHGVAVASSANTSSRMILRPKKQKPPPQPLLVSHGVAAASSASPTPTRSSLLRFEHDLLNFVLTKMFHLIATSAEAAMLIATSLSRILEANLEGILAFYGFAIPTPPVVTKENPPSSLPDGVQFVLNTLPVDAKGIGDGDGFTAYVDTADPMQSTNVPLEVHDAVIAMAQSRKGRSNQKKNVLQNKLNKAGYRIMYTSKDEILAKQYRIRLRGIDAPEMEMQYGKESQNALVKLIADKSVMVYVYEQDRYNRYVGDIYCDGVFIQEQMLKEGHAWHHMIYDKRPEFAKWEKKAQHARRGLWAYDNPEKPWDWKRIHMRRH